jgi:signal transduction histidine kinase
LNVDRLIHDIRNPLNGIAMNAELAKLVLQTTGDTAKALIALETILKNCHICSEQLSGLKQTIDGIPDKTLTLNAINPTEPD